MKSRTVPYPHVVLVGGAPLSGKSTLARLLGRKLGYDVVSTDDLSTAARALTTPSSHPALHPMAGSDYRDYYVVRSLDEVWNESMRAHQALWPALSALIEARASYGRPVVLEGWALLPSLVSPLESASVRAIYLVNAAESYEGRLRALEAFYRGARDEEALIRRFAARSIRFDVFLRAEASSDVLLEVREGESSNVVCQRALGLLREDTEQHA